MNISKDEKAVLINLKEHQNVFPLTPDNYFIHIWNGSGMGKKETKIALIKLESKGLVTMKPNNNTTEPPEIFGNLYKLTESGSLYKTKSGRGAVIGVFLTVITITVMAITVDVIYPHLFDKLIKLYMMI